MGVERREGGDRRDEGAAGPVTLGEVYRLCERIENRMTTLSDGIDKDVHAVRLDIKEHERRLAEGAVTMTRLKDKVEALESKGRDWRGWIASGVIGAGLALLPFLMQWLARR